MSELSGGTAQMLRSEQLCMVEFEVAGGITALAGTPWGDRRWGYISGGRFAGPRLAGVVEPGGGNWSRSGRLAAGETVGTFDARAVWRTDDDALIYVTYTGRSVVSDAVRAGFADPAAAVDPADYYLRIAMVFETAAAPYDWLNGVVAVGVGERIGGGVRHHVHQVL